MIIFLNFAPIEFMGGAEKWMVDVSSFMNKREPSTLISMSEKMSNLYGQLVLQRRFDKRAQLPPKSCSEDISLDFMCFLPFSKKWRRTRQVFKKARRIYSKFEVMELGILLYFGGFAILQKTVAGLHSPFIYYKPARFLDRLHNFVYTSSFIKFFLEKMYKIHVINQRDQTFLETEFLLPQVKYIPNGVKIHTHKLQSPQPNKKLHVLFIGELSARKGVDILIDVIKRSPTDFHFDITSDGPMKNEIKELSLQRENCVYHGYVDHEKKEKLYKQADVLMLPSRGEGFPLVILDGMSHGLLIVDSYDIRLNLPKYIEYTSKNNTAEEYLSLLKKIYQSKVKQPSNFLLQKQKTFTYCVNNLSDKIILSRLRDEIFI